MQSPAICLGCFVIPVAYDFLIALNVDFRLVRRVLDLLRFS